VPDHIKALAVEIGIGEEALKKWGQRGFVPAIRRDELAALAEQRGVTIAAWSWPVPASEAA
jgi:hypothetical protein